MLLYTWYKVGCIVALAAEYDFLIRILGVPQDVSLGCFLFGVLNCALSYSTFLSTGLYAVSLAAGKDWRPTPC